jgi:hypothetical protein
MGYRWGWKREVKKSVQRGPCNLRYRNLGNYFLEAVFFPFCPIFCPVLVRRCPRREERELEKKNERRAPASSFQGNHIRELLIPSTIIENGEVLRSHRWRGHLRDPHLAPGPGGGPH